MRARSYTARRFTERHLEGLGGPKPKGGIPTPPGRRGPGPPRSLPQGAGLPVFEKRVQLKEALPEAARGSPMKDGSSPPRVISPEPDYPKRQVLKAQTPLPKIRTPRDFGNQPYMGPGSGYPQGGAIASRRMQTQAACDRKQHAIASRMRSRATCDRKPHHDHARRMAFSLSHTLSHTHGSTRTAARSLSHTRGLTSRTLAQAR